jgi:cobalt/nickel transport system ATP-binding protein
MLFELDRLTYQYERLTALDNLTLSIPEGSRAALLGANGSGKSTLLRLLDGLHFPHAGAIRFRGEELTEERFGDDAFAFTFRQQVGLVFQNPDVQLFNPTVFDEVAFGPLQLRWPKAEVRERVAEILDRLRIGHLKERVPHRLSGGEKKRVALASVLVLDPAVLLLDEPTASLDPRSQSQLIDLLVEWGGGAKSVIIATPRGLRRRCCAIGSYCSAPIWCMRIGIGTRRERCTRIRMCMGNRKFQFWIILTV